MNLDLRLIKYFVVLAEELHFSRAAERLHISQPALSKQIRQLEERLRVTLLLRSSKHVRLTTAGETLLPRARGVLDAWSDAVTATRDVAAADSRTLRVGFVTCAAGELTPLILAAFAARRPRWRVWMQQVPWNDPSCGLLSGAVDVAFLRLPVPGADELRTRVLVTESRWVALPATHPLAAQEAVDLAELLDEPFLVAPPDAGTWRDFWLAVDERAGHPVNTGAEVKTTDEWLEAIANGYGLSFTPAASTRFYLRPDITYRPVKGVSPSQLAVASRRDDRRRVVQEFVRAAEEVAAGTTATDPTDKE